MRVRKLQRIRENKQKLIKENTIYRKQRSTISGAHFDTSKYVIL